MCPRVCTGFLVWLKSQKISKIRMLSASMFFGQTFDARRLATSRQRSSGYGAHPLQACRISVHRNTHLMHYRYFRAHVVAL